MSSVKQETAAPRWWRPRNVPDGRNVSLQLGPLELKVARSTQTWLLAVHHDDEKETSSRAKCRVGRGLPEVFDERYVHADTVETVQLEPVLADRPVVIRPHQPIYLLGHQEITLYLSTPVNIRVCAGDPATLLREVPSHPMSDTWFGPSSREGELCYAGRTHARHHIEELPSRPNRAITPLLIRNRTDTVLPLEKVSLPVPMLTLYGAEDSSLWTQQVTLNREEAGDLARVTIDSRPPEVDRELERLALPRQDPGRSNLVVRAFSSLFGG